MAVIDLVHGHESCSASARVGGVVVGRVGTREASVGESQELRPAFLNDDGAVNMACAHAVSDNVDYILRTFVTRVFAGVGARENAGKHDQQNKGFLQVTCIAVCFLHVFFSIFAHKF